MGFLHGDFWAFSGRGMARAFHTLDSNDFFNHLCHSRGGKEHFGYQLGAGPGPVYSGPAALFFFFLFFFTIFVCFYIEDGDVEMRMAAGSEHQNGHEAWYALLWYISRLDERRDTGVIIEHLIKIQSASSYRA